MVWKVGDRASWSASPTCAENRRVYTGEIVEVNGNLVTIVDDGWGAKNSVRVNFLHPEGSAVIHDSGPRGITWKA